MTFSRVRPSGFLDGVGAGAGGSITATEANQLDTNQSRAMDGVNGGSYSPSAPIVLNGEGGVQFGADGGSGLTFCRVTGTYTLVNNSRGAFLWRVGTLPNIGSPYTVDAESDVYYCDEVIFNITYTLDNTLGTEGQVLTIVRPHDGFSTVTVQSGPFIAGVMCTMPQPSGLVATSSASFIYIGSQWRLLQYDAEVTPGGAA